MPVTDIALAPESASGVAAVAPRPSLVGMPRPVLAEFLRTIGVPEKEIRMRVSQLWQWIYTRGAQDFSEMTNVARAMHATLEQHASLARPEMVREQVSSDGTRKWVLRMPSKGPHDRGAEVECVYIPERDRGTLCVSSQVGCTLNCSFCHTGTQKLVRNLEAWEIVAQVVFARDRLGDYHGKLPPEGAFVPNDGGRFVSNLVFMGMGEPLYAYDEVRAAIGVLTDPDGMQFSKRKVTVSTSGVVPEIYRLGEETGVALAISLHATNDALRDVLVPINKKYPIKDLMKACAEYPGASNARRITFEYVMLKGVNDSLAEARALTRLFKGVHAKINLIPFNPWPGTIYECSDWEQIERFSDVIFEAGYASPIRTPRGRDILAACGQLKSDTEKMRARARMMLEESLALGTD
jgi:23S rRNA (adenine2503-C2)-methyltransferase